MISGKSYDFTVPAQLIALEVLDSAQPWIEEKRGCVYSYTMCDAPCHQDAAA